MASGTLAVNGLTDEQFIKLIQIKDKSNGKLNIPLNTSIGQTQQQNIGGKQVTVINGVSLNFNDPEGAKFAAEVLQMLAGG